MNHLGIEMMFFYAFVLGWPALSPHTVCCTRKKEYVRMIGIFKRSKVKRRISLYGTSKSELLSNVT